jgi:hypothetical protein
LDSSGFDQIVNFINSFSTLVIAIFSIVTFILTRKIKSENDNILKDLVASNMLSGSLKTDSTDKIMQRHKRLKSML